MVLASGVFDGIHAGHVAYLQAAKALCDPLEWLIVAVADDEYVRQAKGHEPKWPVLDRINAVRALSMVSGVATHDTSGACAAIRLMRPRLFVKGDEWAGRMPVNDERICRDVGCQIAFVPMTDCAHTSEVA